jgi:hypothetical protein
MFRKVVLNAAALVTLSACQPENVYSRAMPEGMDANALNNIRDGLKPEDREAWTKIVMRKANPLAGGVASKTVGDAIAKMKAQTACMESHSLNGIDPSDHEDYNAEVRAYNECLKLPV